MAPFGNSTTVTGEEVAGLGALGLSLVALRRQMSRLARCVWMWIRRHRREHREFNVLHKEHLVCQAEFADMKKSVTAIDAKTDVIITLLRKDYQ